MRAVGVQLLLFASTLICVQGFQVNTAGLSLKKDTKARSAPKVWTASQNQDNMSRRAALGLFFVAPSLAVGPSNAQTAQIGWGDAQKA